MEYKIDKVLLSKEEIQKRVTELGAEIAEKYKGQEIICICVLTGAFVFLADLVRAIGKEVDVKVDFMVASSYGNRTETSGVVKIHKDLSTDIAGKKVVIVEDVLDSGVSLSYLLNMLKLRNPESIEICVCFNKPARRKKEVPVDYTGFTLPDEFIVGYGLDYAEQYRNLDGLYTLKVVSE